MNTRVLGILALGLGLCAATVYKAFAVHFSSPTLSIQNLGAAMQITVYSDPDTFWYIQAATNINADGSASWTTISTNAIETGSAGSVIFIDTNSPAYPQRFYRASSGQ